MRNGLQLWKSNRWSPWKDMATLQKGFDHLFDDYVAAPASENALTNAISPVCDVEETDTGYFLTFDLPGVLKEDIKIEVSDNQVRLSGEKRIARDEKKASYHMSERFSGRFERILALPTKVDIEKTDAQYKDGVLRVSLPKASGTISRQINITEGPTTKRTS
jgi:HSP20 family protein